jgi:hypothetical protein
MTASDDDLRTLGEELRALFAEERKAIAKLDHDKLAWLAEQKRVVVDRIAAIRPAQPSPALKTLFEAIRAEARATAMLAATATAAVRALLGRQVTGYDRHARRTETTAFRLRATY